MNPVWSGICLYGNDSDKGRPAAEKMHILEHSKVYDMDEYVCRCIYAHRIAGKQETSSLSACFWQTSVSDTKQLVTGRHFWFPYHVWYFLPDF